MELMLWFIISILILSQAKAAEEEDKAALLEFVQKLPPSRPLNWNGTSSPCTSWTGVTCDRQSSRVIAIHLPAFGFHGPIPPNTISRLTCLQTLSLRSNFITAHFPSDFSNLKNLTFLYLHFNNFTGPLPDFSPWTNLSVLDLSNNRFSGHIPPSLSTLPRLAAVNLANNSLSGEIPLSLQRFPKAAFLGNNLSLQLQPSPHSVKHRQTTLLSVVVAAGVFALAGFLVFVFLWCSRKRKGNVFARKLHKGEVGSGEANLKRERKIAAPEGGCGEGGAGKGNGDAGLGLKQMPKLLKKADVDEESGKSQERLGTLTPLRNRSPNQRILNFDVFNFYLTDHHSASINRIALHYVVHTCFLKAIMKFSPRS
uniref:Inactive receptor kinase At4g23740 family n=1 Tax=Cajanus cajan TaxID=3821 RepID=A0A151TK27_CAJCA|nr:putative inactive receptor kinase At4g23740 family [Cajanus cajan]